MLIYDFCANGSEELSPGKYFKDKLLIHSYSAGSLRLIAGAKRGVYFW